MRVLRIRDILYHEDTRALDSKLLTSSWSSLWKKITIPLLRWTKRAVPE